MPDERVYFMVTVTVARKREFNAFWMRESLPYWEKFCKHVGSYTCNPFAGGASNQIVRIFEFENLDRWVAWEKWLHYSDEGKALMSALGQFSIVTETRLMAPAPF